MYENAMENRGRGGNSTEHEPRGAAHSNSEGSTGAGNHVKREETQTNKNETPISRQRGQNGRGRDSAYTERAGNHERCQGQTSSRPIQYCAGDGRTQTVAEERNVSPRPVWGYEEGGWDTQARHLSQTEASDSPYGSVRTKNSLTRPTIWRRKPNVNSKNGATVWAGPIKAKLFARREHGSVTSMSAGL